MIESTSKRFRDTLHHEIMQWESEGMVAPELARQLTARYPVLPQSNRAVTIALILGAILVGLGVLLFVGSNWQHLSAILKLVLLIGSILVSYILGWRYKYEPGKRPKLGDALIFLGSILYGASIWLISQIFNFDTNASQGLLFWGLGCGVMAYITRSVPVAVLSSILIPIWNISLGWENPQNIDLTLEAVLRFIVSMSLGMWLSSIMRSRAAMYVLLCGGAIFTVETSMWSGALAYGCALLSASFCLSQRKSRMASPPRYVGASIALFACLMSTLNLRDFLGPDKCQMIASMLLGISALPVMLTKWHEKISCKAAIATIMVGGIGLCLTHIANDFWHLLMWNFEMLAMISGLLFVGVKLQRPVLVNISIVALALDIVFRYFDMFFSMMDRSLFFVMGGLVLIIAGSILEKNRRKLTGAMT